MEIQKLDIAPTQSVATNHCIINKINELVDAVNSLRADVDHILNYCPMDLVEKLPENVQSDPYAEQRQWIGRLCRFRQGFGAATTYGILSEISTDSDLPYYKKDTDTYWKYCEPVSPDDDIIYKKEQQ